MAILCALQSSTISRLKRTWDGVPTKYLNSLDLLRKATEHSRNYAEYRSRIRDATTTCLPFVGLFLTDVTFCFEGNGKERISLVDKSIRLINFDRYAVSFPFPLSTPSNESKADFSQNIENGQNRFRFTKISSSL